MTRCDGDSLFARFIDTEAEVDEDLSDDDEAELDNDYDRYSHQCGICWRVFLTSCLGRG